MKMTYSMDGELRMQMDETEYAVGHNGFEVLLLKRASPNVVQIGHGPSGAVLHDDPELTFEEVAVDIRYDVRTGESAEEGDLGGDRLDLLGVLAGNDLDGELVVGRGHTHFEKCETAQGMAYKR